MKLSTLRILILTIFGFAAALPARAQQDPAELLLRLSRLEAQIRQMSGQIEQLQFQNRKLDEDLQRFRKDTDLRFEDVGKGQPALRQGAAPQPSAAPRAAAPITAGSRRGDAFDPNANPSAPGAPMPLGSTPPTAALPRSGQSTIDTIIEQDGAPGQRQASVGAPLDLSQGGAGQVEGLPQRNSPPIGVSPPNQTRADFDAAIGMMQRGEYAGAEMAFRQFLQSHPRSQLVSDATYWLGESYFQRNLHRDAAEQYLKVSTNWPQATRAADSMLKLGMSLNALGARDQACSTYREVDRKYPNASQTVKRGVEREFKRARCAA
ncbi:tol-pal system protein YbgF [Terrarubrum flagellatum]|uniref:tol-pal system protein YbgF n=1 Tax=Terrirubrum flagellatum TaxID=2895980 RepID=UPI0031450BA9